MSGLNYERIRERINALSLSETTVTALLGVRPRDLEAGLDERTVSLQLLQRFSRVLDLTLDELVAEEPSNPPPDPDCADAQILLAAVGTYSGLHRSRLAGLLGWTHQRLEDAVRVMHDQLQPTGLHVIDVNGTLTLAIRPGALPVPTRAELDRVALRLRFLSTVDAPRVLDLVREKILEPFPDPAWAGREESLDAAWLVERELAVPCGHPGDHGRTAAIEIHPDMMFALGLGQAPGRPRSGG